MLHSIYKDYLILLISNLLLISCSYNRTQTDGAPRNIPNLSRIKNMIPSKQPYSKYGNPKQYTVFNKKYTVFQDNPTHYTERGLASWYGTKFHGRRTSSGESYDMFKMTAAHKTLRIPAYVKVKNLNNNKEIIVKINDRGPFHKNRIIDLSYVAAHKLDLLHHGTAPVKITLLNPKEITSQPPALSTTQKNKERNIYLQLGAFEKKNNALNLLNKIKQNTNFSLRNININLKKTPNWYKVELGPIHEKALLRIKKEAEKITHHAALIINPY